MDPTKEILELKSRIEEDKAKQSRAEGAIQSITDQLKKDFGIASIDEAKKVLVKRQEELEEMEKEIEISIKQFRDKYGI